MAVAPAVVTEKWVRDSIAAKKLLRGPLRFRSNPMYPTDRPTPFFFLRSHRQVRARRPGKREEVGVQAEGRVEAGQGPKGATFRRQNFLRHE
jgi:hypothetical protein